MNELSDLTTRRIRKWGIGAILIIGLIIIGVAFGISTLVLDSDIAVAIITAGATVFVSVSSAILAQVSEKEKIIEQQIREKKTPVYEKIIETLFSIIFSVRIQQNQTIKNNPKTPQIDFVARLDELTPHLTIWSTDDVLRSWIKFREVFTEAGKNPDKYNPQIIMFSLEEFLYAIRKDLGHKNFNLAKGDLLSIFINDIKNYV